MSTSYYSHIPAANYFRFQLPENRNLRIRDVVGVSVLEEFNEYFIDSAQPFDSVTHEAVEECYDFEFRPTISGQLRDYHTYAERFDSDCDEFEEC
ncbi:hypothetical protein [Yaravirus sp. 'brasiliensis']|uniref:Uncharacterized protein n=1 Tax=Yaravirus sp. 'brasiliensis' TaxID=2739681 RepID=A0AAE7B4G5_9VIRU|nr:hypothetical protein QKS73_gp62 [Yaravirus brasiliensis]QKE44415.1 hypothetical protein [Yaravirus brasiliensis]